MKKKTRTLGEKARKSITEVEYQLLQNQGAIILALEHLLKTTCPRGVIYAMNLDGLHKAVDNTGSLMSRRRKR